MAYLASAVTARIQELDFDASAWKTYTALCVLAKIRGTVKKTVEARVFGTDKPSQSFRQAWNIADKLFSAGMSVDAKAAIGEMNIDEAFASALAALAAHMTTLGVAGKNAYLEVAHFSSMEELKASEDKAAADNKAEADAKAEAEAAAAEAAAKAEAEAAAKAGDTAVSLEAEAEAEASNVSGDTWAETIIAAMPQIEDIAELDAIMSALLDRREVLWQIKLLRDAADMAEAA